VFAVLLNTTIYSRKAKDIKYIWKLKVVVWMSYLFEVYVRGECTWSRF